MDDRKNYLEGKGHMSTTLDNLVRGGYIVCQRDERHLYFGRRFLSIFKNCSVRNARSTDSMG